MYNYKIYGLHILSSHNLAGLVVADQELSADVVVNWLGPLPAQFDTQRNWQPLITPELQQRNRINLWQAKEEEGVYLRLQFIEAAGNIDFIIDPLTSSVDIYWPSALLFLDVQAYFIGAFMACLLRRRGVMCLHASVVECGGKAIAILGNKRAGKSTTAASLVKAGWRLLADDVGALALSNRRVYVQAGYPQLRLCPKAVTSLYGTVNNLRQVYSKQVKYYVDLELAAENSSNEIFCYQSMPLTAIYILGKRSAEFQITILPPQKKMMSLIANTVGNYMVTDATMRARDFTVISQLAQSVPMRHLQAPNCIDQLPDLCAMILEDFYQRESDDSLAQLC